MLLPTRVCLCFQMLCRLCSKSGTEPMYHVIADVRSHFPLTVWITGVYFSLQITTQHHPLLLMTGLTKYHRHFSDVLPKHWCTAGFFEVENKSCLFQDSCRVIAVLLFSKYHHYLCPSTCVKRFLKLFLCNTHALANG